MSTMTLNAEQERLLRGWFGRYHSEGPDEYLRASRALHGALAPLMKPYWVDEAGYVYGPGEQAFGFVGMHNLPLAQRVCDLLNEHGGPLTP